jgi:O-Antigen ligase
MPRATHSRIARLSVGLVLLVPSGLLLGLALRSGGFFPDSVSVAVGAAILIFVVRAVWSPTAFSGVGTGVSVVAAALIAFSTWTLISGSWSGSSARATFAYNLALLYTTVFLLTGILGRSEMRARVLLYGVTVASVGISIVAAATWLLPDLLPVASNVGRGRLSWPTTYWNATGLIAALAIVWTLSLSCSSSEPARVRVLGALVAPWPAATLIFTASRGAAGVAVLGVVLAVITIRSSATPGGVAALVPAVAASVAISLGVSGLDADKPAARAVHGGHRTALLLVAVALASAAVRTILLRLDVRLARASAPWTRVQFRAAVGTAAAVLVIVFLSLGGVSKVRAAAHKFVAPETQSVSGNLARQRLTELGNNGRIDEWRVAFDDGFLRHPVKGTGAGTYATLWTRYAPTFRRVLNAHSLYIEELAELGVVGGGLLIASIVSMLVALARLARGAERQVWAALLSGGVMWALHAGVDWDWQMPAVTAWFFAAGGLALAMPTDRPQRETHPRIRFAVGLGCLLIAVAPVAVWRSQTQIVNAVAAFERGNCPTAEHDALASNSALGSRWDPLELISYCEAGLRRYSLALIAIRDAELRDPQNWELRYSYALIRASAGLDPRPAARVALALYPTSPLTRAAIRAFSTGGPRAWRRFAISAPLPLPWTKQ